MVKMERKGISTVVAVSLIVLLTISAAAIFISFYVRGIDRATQDERALCLGIDLKVSGCFIFPQTFPINPPLNGSALLVNVERLPGGKNIAGLKLLVIDSNGIQHVEDPVNLTLGRFVSDTDYSDLVEFNSIDSVVRDLTYTPKYIYVVATVGKSQTICPATRERFECVSI
ncbi:MAG: hypothetical protein AABW71_03775 [Nanoarchaeota archaeon]